MSDSHLSPNAPLLQGLSEASWYYSFDTSTDDRQHVEDPYMQDSHRDVTLVNAWSSYRR